MMHHTASERGDLAAGVAEPPPPPPHPHTPSPSPRRAATASVDCLLPPCSNAGGSLGQLDRLQGPSRLPAGMMNLGNTCHLNAVLQVNAAVF